MDLARTLVAGMLVMIVMAYAGPAAAAEPTPRTRRFMLGIEGVGLQVPALRPRITAIDPRFLGRSVTLEIGRASCRERG